MRRAIRVLMPNESGAGKRVVEAVLAAKGKVLRSRIKLLARDTSLKEILVSCDGEKEVLNVILSLEALEGISVLGVDHVGDP